MRIIYATFFALSALAVSVTAADARSGPQCKRDVWDVVTIEQLEKIGLKDKHELFMKGLWIGRSLYSVGAVRVVVTDCSRTGDAVSVTKMPPREGHVMLREYNVYVTRAFLRDAGRIKIEEEALTQVCRIHLSPSPPRADQSQKEMREFDRRVKACATAIMQDKKFPKTGLQTH